MYRIDKNSTFKGVLEDFSFGMHNVIVHSKNYVSEALEIANNICCEGLRVNSREGGVAATVRLFGLYKDLDCEHLERYMFNYPYEMNLYETWLSQYNPNNVSILIAIPSYINGYFVGDYPDFYSMGINSNEQKNQSGMIFPMERYIKEIGYIPKEFILGFLTTREGDFTYTPNDSFLGLMSDDDKKQYYSDLLDDMALKGIDISMEFTKDKLDFIRTALGYKKK